MKQNNLKSSIRKFTPQKRRAVAEVISSLLLVVVTVAGAIMLTTFMDESFVSGSLAVSSSTDSSLKTIKLWAYDTRDGSDLMAYSDIDNTTPTDLILCRSTCVGAPNSLPAAGGTEFLVIQIENQGLNPIFLHDVYLDNINHAWDSASASQDLSVAYPADGTFSILKVDSTTQNSEKQIQNGQTVNLLIKLDSINPDIDLSKTIRVELDVGANTLADFLIESGGAK